MPLISLPTTQRQTLFHVGTLDLSLKSPSSHEGYTGLSVSPHPKAWRQISRMTEGHSFRLTNPDGLFVSVLDIDTPMWNSLYRWGGDSGYLIPSTVFRVSHYDDEFDSRLFSDFHSLSEAEIEADGLDGEIEMLQSWKGTSLFARCVGAKNIEHLDLITFPYAKQHLDVDGLYWDCTLDTSRYSAPRATIFQTKLPRWGVEKFSFN
jgi:hypothetical protein